MRMTDYGSQRAKYQFEADSEDDAMEDEIDSNLDALHGAAVGLKGVAGAMSKEVDSQNVHIGRITEKTDRVDDQVRELTMTSIEKWL